MKNYIVILFLVLAGCSAQPYDEINVWTSTNAPSDPAWVQIGGQTTAAHTICIQSDNARIQDLVSKIAEHEQIDVRWDVHPTNTFCTVNLTDVAPLDGLNSIAGMFAWAAVSSNGIVIIRKQ